MCGTASLQFPCAGSWLLTTSMVPYVHPYGITCTYTESCQNPLPVTCFGKFLIISGLLLEFVTYSGRESYVKCVVSMEVFFFRSIDGCFFKGLGMLCPLDELATSLL